MIPDDTVRLAPPTLGADGLAVMAFTGTGRLVITELGREDFYDAEVFVGDVTQAERVSFAFETFRPELVFHAGDDHGPAPVAA